MTEKLHHPDNRQSEERRAANATIAMLAAQELENRYLVVGEGLQRPLQITEPWRILNGHPVFHCHCNVFNVGIPAHGRQLRKWGQFYDPDFLTGMPPVGALHRLYTDTQIAGWYILWCRSSVDEFAFGKSDDLWTLLAWTPRAPNDSRLRAGTRLFRAHMMHRLCLKADESYEYESDWPRYQFADPLGCFPVIASLRKTDYPDKKSLNEVIQRAPVELKERIKANAVIAKKPGRKR
jgi:hypothetical protein